MAPKHPGDTLAGMSDRPTKPVQPPVSSGSPLTPPPVIGGPHPEASNPHYDQFRGRNRKRRKGPNAKVNDERTR